MPPGPRRIPCGQAALWHAALPGLTPSRGAIVQLLVPVLAAVGGVALLGETITPRLLVSGAAIVAGVAVANWRRLSP